jgi:hypothetical protein
MLFFLFEKVNCRCRKALSRRVGYLHEQKVNYDAGWLLERIWMVAKQEYCLPYIFVASTYMENLLNPSLLVIFSRNHDIYGLISSHVISNINTSFYFDLSLQKRLKKITNLSIGIYSYKLKQCFCVMLINVRNFHVFFLK